MLLFKHVLPSSASEPLTLEDTRLTQPELTGSLVAQILICFPNFSYRSRERRQSVFTRSAPLWTASQAACLPSYTDLLIRTITPFGCSRCVLESRMSPSDVFSHMQNCTNTFSTMHCHTPGPRKVGSVAYNVTAWMLRSERIFGTSYVASAPGILLKMLLCGSTLSVSTGQRD